MAQVAGGRRRGRRAACVDSPALWTHTQADKLATAAYTFSKYNTSSNPFSYSTEEYLHHLRDDDWTREETDYLFSLLQTYDLRFTIVMDRYDFPDKERTVEQLKARYYSVCQKLIAARPSTGTEEERAKEISSYNFDPVREAERKAHVASLIWRSPAQIAEEDFLYIESRRLEQNALRFSQERDALMSTLDGMLYQLVKSQADISLGVGGPGAIAGPGPSSSAVAAAKKARRSDAHLFDGADLVEPPGGGKKVSKAQLASDALNCVYRFDGPAPLNQPPVTLRSSRVSQPKASLAPRITSLLAELGMPTMGKHLVMPTRANVARYEELLNACATLVELKRQVERADGELEVQKKKKAALGGVVAPPAEAAAKEAEGSEPPKTARSTSAAVSRRPRSATCPTLTCAFLLQLKRSPSASSTASGPRERKRSRRA